MFDFENESANSNNESAIIGNESVKIDIESINIDNGYIDKKCAPVPMDSIKSLHFPAFLAWCGYREIKNFIIPTKL